MSRKDIVALRDFAQELAERTSADKIRSVFNTWLVDKAEATKAAYQRELEDFARFCKHPSVDEVLWAFVNRDKQTAHAIALMWKTNMLEDPPKGRGLMPTTVNRRLAALRSVVSIARMAGDCTWNSGLEIDNAHVGEDGVYRDTRGPGTEAFKKVLYCIEEEAQYGTDKSQVQAKRDVAILRFLHDMGLRRSEVLRLLLTDIRVATQSVMITPKGRGPLSKRPKKEWPVPPGAWAALLRWLDARPQGGTAVFVSLHHAYFGSRMSPGGINWIIKQWAMRAGFPNGRMPDGRAISPHGFRHTAITTILERSGGNLAMAQDFSRHRNVNTLRRYDDARGVRVRSAQELLSQEDEDE